MIRVHWRANSRPVAVPALGHFPWTAASNGGRRSHSHGVGGGHMVSAVGLRHPTTCERGPTPLPRSTSLTAIARPGVGIAQEGNATLQRQPVARQADIDVVIA